MWWPRSVKNIGRETITSARCDCKFISCIFTATYYLIAFLRPANSCHAIPMARHFTSVIFSQSLSTNTDYKYVTFGYYKIAIAIPPVCRLSVTLVHPTQGRFFRTFWTIWYRTLGMASSNSHTKLVLVHSFWSDRFENNLHRSINAVNAHNKPNYNDVQRIKAHHNQYRVLLAAVPGFTRVTGKPLSKMLMRLQPATPVDLPIRSPVSCLLVIGHFP